jgi:glucose/mannose-6-phosphate isomerase
MATTQNSLDAPSFRSHDPQDMLGAILGLPEQVDDAKRIALGVSFDQLRGRKFSSLVIAGMGGSAIGGDFLRALYEPTLRAPVTVIRDYQLPGYVGPDTLVFVASNSGKTEETLSCYEQAKRAKCAIVAFTTGGALLEDAATDGNRGLRLGTPSCRSSWRARASACCRIRFSTRSMRCQPCCDWSATNATPRF